MLVLPKKTAAPSMIFGWPVVAQILVIFRQIGK